MKEKEIKDYHFDVVHAAVTFAYGLPFSPDLTHENLLQLIKFGDANGIQYIKVNVLKLIWNFAKTRIHLIECCRIHPR